MSIVDNIDRITAWAQANICDKVMLKLPDDDAVDASYTYQLVNPSAFPLFVPTKDRLPPGFASPIPSLCVQLIEGKDITNSGSMKIRFAFSAWDPGLHGQDFLLPKKDEPGAYSPWNTPEALAFFQKNGSGWRDVWGFVDVALRELESAGHIDGLSISKDDGIAFGPFTEQDAIPDFYPYWFAWVSFTVEYGIMRNHPDYQDFL